jgi:PAS domain-containing protein
VASKAAVLGALNSPASITFDSFRRFRFCGTSQIRRRTKTERIHLTFNEWATTCGARVALHLYAAAQHVGQLVRSLHSLLVGLGHVLGSGRSRLQEVLRQKETELAKVLADSIEAVVVTDDAHRILAANAAALTLLGVSEGNLHRFAIDAFLPQEQVHYFERSSPHFIKSAERVGVCEIRPLVGKAKVVEFSFQANFTLGCHLSRFRDVAVRKHLMQPAHPQAPLASKSRWIA